MLRQKYKINNKRNKNSNSTPAVFLPKCLTFNSPILLSSSMANNGLKCNSTLCLFFIQFWTVVCSSLTVIAVVGISSVSSGFTDKCSKTGSLGYAITKIAKYIIEKIEISSDSDEESSDDKN